MPKYAYDPEYLPFLDALPTISDLADPQGIVEGRATRAAMMGQATDPLPGVARRDVAVPGRDGDPDVPVRVYAPQAAASAPRRNTPRISRM